MLFNSLSEDTNFESVYKSLSESDLSVKGHEDEIISRLSDMQRSTVEAYETGLGLYNKFLKFSTSTLNLSSSCLESDSLVTLDATKFNLLSFADGDGIEFVSQNNLVSLFSPFIFQYGDLFTLVNKAVDVGTETTEYTLVSTRDTIDEYSLQNKDNQIIELCSLSLYGELTYEQIAQDAAISRFDTTRLFYGRDEMISLMNHSISTPEYEITASELKLNSVTLAEGAILGSLLVGSGAVTVFSLGDLFLSLSVSKVDDYSPITEIKERNILSVGEFKKNFRTDIAPKTGWTSRDLRKSDSKTDSFLSEFGQTVVNSNPVSGNEALIGLNSVVSKSELDKVLSNIASTIMNLDVCDDN